MFIVNMKFILIAKHNDSVITLFKLISYVIKWLKYYLLIIERFLILGSQFHDASNTYMCRAKALHYI